VVTELVCSPLAPPRALGQLTVRAVSFCKPYSINPESFNRVGCPSFLDEAGRRVGARGAPSRPTPCLGVSRKQARNPGYIFAGATVLCPIRQSLFHPETEGRVLKEAEKLLEKRVSAWQLRT